MENKDKLMNFREWYFSFPHNQHKIFVRPADGVVKIELNNLTESTSKLGSKFAKFAETVKSGDFLFNPKDIMLFFHNEDEVVINGQKYVAPEDIQINGIFDLNGNPILVGEKK